MLEARSKAADTPVGVVCEAVADPLHAILEALHEGVALFDAEDRFVFWNHRYAQIYGVSSTALRQGTSFGAFVKHGAETGQYLEAEGREAAWLTERLAPASAPRRERLPGDRWVRVREQPLADGRVRVVIDTTGVQRTDTSFRLLFEANPVPMSLVDAKTLRFIAMNDAAVAKYGYSHEAALGMTMVDLAPPEVRAGTEAIMTSNIGGYDGQSVWTQVTADGRRIQIRPYVRPLTYEGRACLLCAAVDVTKTVRAEAELRLARDVAETAQRTEADALAALKAALRAPLESLAGPAEALAAADLGPEAKALAQVVREAALSLERVLALST